MGFNEKVHAYIAAKYYMTLTDAFGERGRQAFIHATRHYAMQRGRRMAQRAIRDGQPLTQASYNYYGECRQGRIPLSPREPHMLRSSCRLP